MSNFLTYVNEDIELKKEIISSLPNKTKSNIRDYNKKIEEFIKKYDDYKLNVYKYIELKSNNIEIKDVNVETIENLNNMEEKIRELKYLAKLLNPTNSFYEKLGLDGLLYQLGEYADFDFTKINNIIKELSDKFNLINIKLTSSHFNLTPYVNEYMTAFYSEINNEKPNYFELEKTFEKIYWVCPNLLKHIDTNFRILIRENIDEFKKTTKNLQDESKRKNNIHSYEECMKQLKSIHYKFTYARKEKITDIIELADKGEIDVNDLFPDSKQFIAAQSTLMLQDNRREYNQNMEANHENLKKLKNVLIEYRQYIHFEPFLEYSKNLLKDFKLPKPYNEIIDGRDKLESGMKVINKILNDDLSRTEKFFIKRKKPELLEKNHKQLKADLVQYANQLHSIYFLLDAAHFVKVVKKIANEYVTLDDFLNLFRDYDYFKKKEIKDTFKTKSYDELMEHVEEFDQFCNNPNNMVVPTIPVYQEFNVAKVIVDKYRINNFNLSEDIINPSNIDNLINYIDILLRTTHILECNLKIEQVWFIVEVNKIKEKNKKKETKSE